MGTSAAAVQEECRQSDTDDDIEDSTEDQEFYTESDTDDDIEDSSLVAFHLGGN